MAGVQGCLLLAVPVGRGGWRAALGELCLGQGLTAASVCVKKRLFILSSHTSSTDYKGYSSSS